MAKYSDIKGFTVQTLSTDTVASGVSGGAWASGGALNTGRYGEAQGAGTMTAAILTGGNNGSGGVTVNEYYNGTSWTEQGDTNTAHYNAGQGGTQTSSIIAGGTSNIANTEEWNGSAWTEVNDLNTGRRQLALSSNGNAEAALAFGGYAPPTGGPVGYTDLTESWNGSSWTEVSDLNTSRSSLGATDASYTAALAIGGYRGPPTADRTAFVEQWNGSAWTEIADLNVEKMNIASSGSVTTALASGGGDTSRLATTEFWDGSSWTEIADLSTAREQAGRGGTSTASDSIVSGGWVGSVSDLTEEFTAATVFNQITEGQLYFNSTTNTFKETITDLAGGAWAAGGNLNAPRSMMASASAAPQDAAMAFGGFQTSPSSTSLADTEEYNGTAWTEVNNVNTARRLAVGTGSQPAALMATGQVSPGPGLVTNVELWDGTNWTETTDVNTARRNLAAFGTQTLGLIVGGLTPSITGNTELWNGSSWTETTDLNTGRESYAGFGGSYTSGLVSGGYVSSPNPNSAITETWDGSTWTEVGDLNTGRKQHAASGQSVNSGMINTGYTTTGIANCESWNGTSWTERADVSTARWELGGMGTTAAGLICGGATPSITAAREEFTAPLANKTIGSS